MMDVNMNICYTCPYYQLKDCYCEKYLRGKEIAVFLCPECNSMDDLIRRQVAINQFMTATADGDKFDWCKSVLKQVPSAQPEITAEQVKEFCEERGWVVLTKEEYHWLKSLHENSRLNGGGNY